ncbi:histidine kinase [Pseudomonas sp. 10B238]|uniref:ATP-binding protein n=1 Tax=Pseudomonadaceae TaxID=135621 RepID=UPI000617EF59|nr:MULTISPECIES: ATP-binding protein [Pseudomonadaceae]KJJ62371.1 histidine kinase [Pseudomonas sp. 10B238]MBK3794160.1 response regulator [Stutzerimonas stutzeri]MBK3875650.1 response regulator [Stutzerimonas stutzeri]MBU0950040.1 CHASE3 domain-containing protein [Gammaproteobacteria bacterium]
MPARTLISWHWLAFLIAFILLVALGWQGKQTQQQVLSVSHSLEIITASQYMLTSLQDIETGARGFVLTGDPSYLESYELGLRQIEAHRRGLQRLLEDRAFPDQGWFEQLDRNIAERLMIAADNIQARRVVGLQAAAERLHQAGGKLIMDRLRALLDAVERQERKQLAAANQAVADTIAQSRRLALIGSLLVAALSLAAFWAIRRNLQIRQALAIKAQAGEARLGALLQAIPDNLYAIDGQRRITALSQGSAVQAPAPEAIEPLLLGLLPHADNSLQLRQTTWCEVSRQRTFEVRLVPTGLGDHLAIARDVTELQRSRDTLEDQKVFLRRVVDTDENLIFVRDELGRFLLCNSAFTALLDARPEAIEGRRAEEIAGAERLLPLLQGEGDLLCGSGELRITEIGLTDTYGQERWLQVVKRPMTMPSGACYVVTVAVDMSLRRRMEQMKTEFISTVSHELRTPLTAIRGALGMLVGGVAGHIDEGARPLLDIAHKNSERLVRLINDILDIEKLEAGRLPFHFSRCDVQALTEQALADLKPYGDEYGVRLTLTLPDGPLQAEGNLDPDRFTQVMANLLSNAIKHSPAGGVVSVDLRLHGGSLEIGVQDQGQGIPADFRSRIFERFAQADSSDARKRGGTGLGLAITRSLVQQMHGRIGFDSQEGQGTRFWLRLPVASTQPINPPTAAQALPTAGTSRPAERILVLEPDAPAAEQLAAALQQHGYATLIAETAAKAREMLAEFSIQALTLSPALSDEDSIAFLQNLRSQTAYRHLPVLIVSLQPQRRDNDDGALRGGAVGVIDWLHKPVDPSRVMDVVRACLRNNGVRPRILHVEDDEDLRTLLARLVEPLEIDLLGAPTLSEARQLIDEHRFDLAIIDLMLPDGDGSELFDQLAQSTPPPPVIIFSALDSPVHDSRLALRQLVKSRHDGDELAALIQQLLQQWPPGHTPVSEEVNP